MKRLFALVILVIGISAPVLDLNARGQHPTPSPPQPRQSPNAPTNQNAPQGLDPVPGSVETDKVSQNAENEKELRANVQRLYILVSELKNEVDKPNANLVLDVSFVKRTQEIEKLAKQIKNRVKQ